MTLQGVVSTQGLYLRSGADVIAPSYWGVESTFWLHWRFADTERVHVRET